MENENELIRYCKDIDYTDNFVEYVIKVKLTSPIVEILDKLCEPINKD